MSGSIAHIVGTRPNFMKAAPLIAALTRRGRRQRLIHTGQHYDRALSGVFFEELGLPRPDVDLGVGSGSQAQQTAALLIALERTLIDLRPAVVVVYGDVNSTIAATLAAAKLRIPVAHVEAGLRSFDDSMPEEINRKVTDLLSELLFVTSPEAIDNLLRTGIPSERVHFVGNPMIDTLYRNLDRVDPVPVMARLGVGAPYVVATVHRPSNVDGLGAARRIVVMLEALAASAEVVLPLHPRGRDTLQVAGLRATPRLHVVDPLGYLDFVSLVRGALAVVTDSGGIQEETTMLRVPCLTIRPNTERPITISHGTNRLLEPEDVGPAVQALIAGDVSFPDAAPPLWDGSAGERIAEILGRWLDHERP